MVLMIMLALVVIPTQIEQLASLWVEKKTLGTTYEIHRFKHRHVVVSSSTLKYDTIFHFLSEFYAHRRNQSIHTVLLSPNELDIQLKSLLHTPLWKQRVFYVNGSALRNADLDRAKVDKADAVFIISCRGTSDKDEADQHTILRSWAIKDFAPNTPQYVALFRPENRIHVKFVEHIVCEDELKYALLANNCLCPGISTLVTLLIHKAALKEKPKNEQGWQNLYAHLARNEIHAITAENSKFFQEFIGKPFTYAAYAVHQKYNVCLIGVATFKKEYKCSLLFDNSGVRSLNATIEDMMGLNSQHSILNSLDLNSMSKRSILLNPGSNYQIESQDLCFYISLFKEENYEWKTTIPEELNQNSYYVGRNLHLKSFASPLTPNESDPLLHKVSSDKRLFSPLSSISEDYETTSSSKLSDFELTIGKPPYPLYIGCLPPLCKLLKIPKPVCCLELDKKCQHKCCTQASDYKWKNKCVIIAAESAKNGLFNFILPLRAKIRSEKQMKPIVLLLENQPSDDFLESICSFPLIYWMQGDISNVATLLKAGIINCDALVVTSTEKHERLEDESLSDCSNIFSVQNICRLFPNVNVIAELTKPHNIRFMKYRAKQMEKEQISNIFYRKPFVSGNVFSDAMIETLTSLAFRKPYTIELIRLLIGISYSEGSGNLKSTELTEEDLQLQTYGNLYRKLATTTNEIPIGIYRTEKQDRLKEDRLLTNNIQRLLEIKMTKLKIDPSVYESSKSQLDTLSYVLINPSTDFKLQCGDIVYLLKPGKPH